MPLRFSYIQNKEKTIKPNMILHAIVSFFVAAGIF